jgi:hypothetical protein
MPERVAIVGSGLAAIATCATLRHRGVAAEEIAVFGTHEDPTEVWRDRAAAIRQTRMRSESEGHLAAAAWPGLALHERNPRAWAETLVNRYHPPVELFLRHADRVVAKTGWARSFHQRRIERVAAVDGGFELDGEGPFEHVLLATGHPGLARPILGAVHAYEPHDYAAKVTIVGAGMAAAHEWLNALGAGSEVVSVRRREPTRRPLNVPRPLLTKRGLDAYHHSSPEQHAATLRTLSQPSYPSGTAWDEPLAAAEREGRFRVTAEVNGAEHVICATGFLEGYANDPLLARLAAEHDLPTHDRWLVLAPDSTVTQLTNGRTLAIAGVAGQWAFPAADTIAGAKYAARAFARRVCRTR